MFFIEIDLMARTAKTKKKASIRIAENLKDC